MATEKYGFGISSLRLTVTTSGDGLDAKDAPNCRPNCLSTEQSNLFKDEGCQYGAAASCSKTLYC